VCLNNEYCYAQYHYTEFGYVECCHAEYNSTACCQTWHHAVHLNIDYCYAECHYKLCCYAECRRHAECCGAFQKQLQKGQMLAAKSGANSMRNVTLVKGNKLAAVLRHS
jgi:hypothetical protein